MKLSNLVLLAVATFASLAAVSCAEESNSQELSQQLDSDIEILDREIRSAQRRNDRKGKNAGRRNRGRNKGRNKNKGRGKNKNKNRNRPGRRRTKRPPRTTTTTTARPPAPQQSMDEDSYLEKFGYLAKPRTGVQQSPAARKEAIKNFQRFNHLKVTGYLDAPTRRQMTKPRCGLPDFIPRGVNPGQEALRNPSKNPEKYYVPGFKWDKKRLTWRSINYSRDLPQGSQRRAFYRAFQHWSKVAPLEFRETGSTEPDIEIKFGVYEHGDGYQNSFDGRGGTLAHAYFPKNGDTHFDDSELWTENMNEGTNLMIVATHEFGHALGLGHSNVRGALMAPYYQGYDPNFKLHNDDIMAIQSLYGSRPKPTPKPTTAPPKPPRPATTSRPRITTSKPKPTTRPGAPDMCTTKFDAVVQAHDYKVYIFKGKWIWSTTRDGVEPGYPKLIKERFQNPPINIGSAVYSWRTRRTYFFKGRYVFRYYGFEREKKIRIADPHFPTQPHAALMGRDGRIYLLQREQYYIFDEYNMRTLNIGTRRIAGLWPGVPNNIEAAVRLRDGYVYFFKGTKYRKYHEESRRVLPGYPKYKAAPWMGPECSKGGKIVPK